MKTKNRSDAEFGSTGLEAAASEQPDRAEQPEQAKPTESATQIRPLVPVPVPSPVGGPVGADETLAGSKAAIAKAASDAKRGELAKIDAELATLGDPIAWRNQPIDRKREIIDEIRDFNKIMAAEISRCDVEYMKRAHEAQFVLLPRKLELEKRRAALTQ